MFPRTPKWSRNFKVHMVRRKLQPFYTSEALGSIASSLYFFHLGVSNSWKHDMLTRWHNKKHNQWVLRFWTLRSQEAHLSVVVSPIGLRSMDTKDFDSSIPLKYPQEEEEWDVLTLKNDKSWDFPIVSLLKNLLNAGWEVHIPRSALLGWRRSPGCQTFKGGAHYTR